jgi:hypothetical protein
MCQSSSASTVPPSTPAQKLLSAARSAASGVWRSLKFQVPGALVRWAPALKAAAATLPGEAPTGESSSGRGFRYTKQVVSGDTAVLDFETTVDGKYVNGVDIIRCDDGGRVVEFRVMVRPLQAVNVVHEQMRAMLESMGPPT